MTAGTSEAASAPDAVNAPAAADTAETESAPEAADVSEAANAPEAVRSSGAANASGAADTSEAAADIQKKSRETGNAGSASTENDSKKNSSAENNRAETGNAGNSGKKSSDSETGSREMLKEKKTDTLSPQVSLVSNTGGEDRDGLLHVNDTMEFVLCVEDRDPPEENQLQAQVFVREEGAGDGERKLLAARADYSGSHLHTTGR